MSSVRVRGAAAYSNDEHNKRMRSYNVVGIARLASSLLVVEVYRFVVA
jgi:hypothetical protein